MLSTLLITADIDLYYLTGIVFVRLLKCETIALLEESHFAHLTLKGKELCFTSWRGIIFKNFLEFFYAGNFSFVPYLFVCLFSYSFMSVWTKGYLSYILGYNPIHYNFLCC